MITEQSMHWHSPPFITYVDFEKAFGIQRCLSPMSTLRKRLAETLFITFVDFEKAFGKNALWKLFGHYGVSEKIVKIMDREHLEKVRIQSGPQRSGIRCL